MVHSWEPSLHGLQTPVLSYISLTHLHKSIHSGYSIRLNVNWHPRITRNLRKVIFGLMVKWAKNPPTMQETQETRVWSLGREDPLKKEMATHSSILAWEIPQTEEPAGLQPMGLQRVGHNYATRHTNSFWKNKTKQTKKKKQSWTNRTGLKGNGNN